MVTTEMAQRLFSRGTNFFGPEEIRAAHGKLHRLEWPGELPSIPWSEEELVAARRAGSHLVLVPPKLTMKEMVEARKNSGTDGGKLLYQIDWYKDESIFTTATTGKKWNWYLVGNGPIANSTGKNSLEQTGVIADELKKIFAGREMPPAYARAIAEYEEKRGMLAKLIVGDRWQEGAKQSAALLLNQLCRPTPVQLFFSLVTYEAVNHERLLQGMYHWSPALSSDGKLFTVGLFDRDGADLRGWSPRYSSDSLGMVLSRSAEVEGGE